MNALAGLQNPNIMGTAVQAFEYGRAKKAESETQNALTKYALNPDDPEAFQTIAKYQPQMAMQIRGQQQRQQEQQRKIAAEEEQQRIGKLKTVAQLFNGVNDDVTYRRGLAIAQQMGLDTSAAPQAYDPNWVEQQKMIVNTFIDKPDALPLIAQEVQMAGFEPGTPEFQAEMSRILKAKYSTVKTVPYQPGGGVAAYDTATGGITEIVVPNTGQPAGAGGGDVTIPAAAIAELKANPGTEKQFDSIFGEGAAEEVLGGGAGNSTGGFQ